MKVKYILYENISERKLKKEYAIYSGAKKIRPHRHLAQILIWKVGLGILDIETQLNFLKINRFQKLLNPTNALW